MTSRTVAIIHWGLAAALLIWVGVFCALTQVPVELTLGVVVSSIFYALGLVLSLSINAAILFRDRPLRRVEWIFLGIEAVLILALVVVGVIDQLEFASLAYPGFGGSFGHLDWFMPSWLLIGPVAITVLVLASINRMKLPPRPAAPSEPES